jgi:hypothetical protein
MGVVGYGEIGVMGKLEKLLISEVPLVVLTAGNDQGLAVSYVVA